MKTPGLLGALALLAACAPAPRSQSYFEAHPDETSAVLSACIAGDHRGAECDAARAADARRKATVRMRSYRKGF